MKKVFVIATLLLAGTIGKTNRPKMKKTNRTKIETFN